MNLKDLAEKLHVDINYGTKMRPTEYIEDALRRVQKETMAARIEWPSDAECRNHALEFYKCPESQTGFLTGIRWLKENIRIAAGEKK